MPKKLKIWTLPTRRLKQAVKVIKERMEKKNRKKDTEERQWMARFWRKQKKKQMIKTGIIFENTKLRECLLIDVSVPSECNNNRTNLEAMEYEKTNNTGGQWSDRSVVQKNPGIHQTHSWKTEFYYLLSSARHTLFVRDYNRPPSKYLLGARSDLGYFPYSPQQWMPDCVIWRK